MTEPSQRQRRLLLFGVLAAGVVIVDQLSKLYIDANFQVAAANPLPGGGAPTQILGEFVRIAKSYNAGGIFGLFGHSALVLALSSLFVIALILYYEWREGSHTWLLTLALALLLGGAIGNFLDRVRLGFVIDFVDMGIGNSRFYTFNVADSAISMALLLLILIALFRERLTRLTQGTAS